MTMEKQKGLQMKGRLQLHKDRFEGELESLVTSMDESDRCVVGKAAGIGVIKLKNGRRAEVQLRITTEREEWIKGK